MLLVNRPGGPYCAKERWGSRAEMAEVRRMSDGATGRQGTMRRWGFIGSGEMATALVKGMLRAGIAPVEAIRASDPLPARTAFSRCNRRRGVRL